MSNVFFIGDLHIGHKTICKYRSQFSSIEEHNLTIEENYNKLITKKDTVYFTGDVAFSREALLRIKNWKGNKILILGNHCTEYNNIFDIVELGIFKSIHGMVKYKEFWVTHSPIHTDELRGKFNIHGHVHSKSINDARYFNTSVENINYTPIEISEIRKVIYA